MLFFGNQQMSTRIFFVGTKVKCNRMLFGFQQNFQLSTTSWWRNLLKNMYRWSAGTSLLKKVDRYMGLHKHCTLDTSTVAKQNRWEMRNGNYPYIHNYIHVIIYINICILVYVNPFTIQNDGNYWISYVFWSMRSAWVEVRVLLWKALRSVEA